MFKPEMRFKSARIEIIAIEHAPLSPEPIITGAYLPGKMPTNDR
jgi:hypothetical protein